jgi:4-amino-4-deoxy-L-arabinose transferase-like glycosyltransferase
MAWAALVPAFRPPDEPQHVDLIRFVRQSWTYPDYDQRDLSNEVVAATNIVRFADGSRHLEAREAPMRRSRPSFAELTDGSATDAVNQMPQHPPLYYSLMAATSSLIHAVIGHGHSFDVELAVLRLLNALLVLPLPLIAYLIAREVTSSGSAVTAALFPLAIPQLHHIGAAVNNDNLLVLLLSLVTLGAVRIGASRASRRAPALYGALAGLALLTKAFGIVAPALLVTAVIVGRRGRVWQAALVPTAVTAGTAFAIGGWWWVRNLVASGRLQPGVRLLPPAPLGFDADPVWFLQRFGAWMPWRYWGWFGWFDTRLPFAIVLVASLAVLAVVVVALWRPPPTTTRQVLGLLLLPTAALFGIVLVIGYRGYLNTGDTPALQGRYLFGGAVGLGAVVAAGAARWRERPVAVTALVASAIMQLSAANCVGRTYWGPVDGTALAQMRAAVAWSPWPAHVVIALGAVTAFVGLWLLLEFGRGPLAALPVRLPVTSDAGETR